MRRRFAPFALLVALAFCGPALAQVFGGNGGGGGAYNSTGGIGVGARGQVIVHSDASDVLTPVVTGGSGHGGGTISMA